MQGSGWVWLGYNKSTARVEVQTCANQDPLSTTGLVPLLGIDVWEHAYYLQYKWVCALRAELARCRTVARLGACCLAHQSDWSMPASGANASRSSALELTGDRQPPPPDPHLLRLPLLQERPPRLPERHLERYQLG